MANMSKAIRQSFILEENGYTDGTVTFSGIFSAFFSNRMFLV